MDREQRIQEIASRIYSALKDDTPSFFSFSDWKGKVVDWSMKDEAFRTQLLRFLDVLPALRNDALAMRVFREYLDETGSAPSFLRGAAETFARGVPSLVAAPIVRASVRSLARQFIAGADPRDALPVLEELRKEGAAFSVDLLGEAVVSENEAASYRYRYLELLDHLSRHWPPAAGSVGRGPLDVSVKVSSFYSRLEPLAWEDSVEKTAAALRPVIEKARETHVSVTFDMEQYYFKDLVIGIFKRVAGGAGGSSPLGIALQAYLKDTRDDILGLIAWAKENHRKILIRLVKGAYWDYESVVNRQKGWPVPVFLNKEETDRNFEELTGILLENAAYVRPAIATHNMRSVSNALARAGELNLSAADYEFQMLYGMDGPMRRALAAVKAESSVRVYTPVGELIAGMAYLVRRILENTSNESFFRRTFAERRSFEELVRPPLPGAAATQTDERGTGFRNEPLTDFSRAENRGKIRDALAASREKTAGSYGLIVNGKDVSTGRESASVNPARPREIVGRVASAAKPEADRAIEAAKKAYASWSTTSADERAGHLFRAAAEMRKRRFSLTALEVRETGKTVIEADADVAEAVDYLEYYGRQMIELGRARALGNLAGEINEYRYEPRGIAAVISPWNFPLAIPTGMASAAIVAGNCAILKPSGLASVTARELVDIFRASGLPRGVLQFLPGPGGEVGEYLVTHPDVDIIAFTGSKDVGLGIVRLAGETRPGQRNVKKVVAEMGGKNAVIVDDTADLDEAVKGVFESAFGYQGQKCSACSRVVVLPDAYAQFARRLTEAVQGMVIGPPEDPAVQMGPLIDAAAQAKVRGYIEKGRHEGKALLVREAPDEGFYAGPALFEAGPDAVIAREEIFGPVLTLIRAADIDDAIAIANASEYALTGGIYSRSPANIRKAKAELRAGNLYVNRKITGALVGRQPFGGFGMSGVGSKAGGPDYLLQFLNPRTMSENTLRKGVAPSDRK